MRRRLVAALPSILALGLVAASGCGLVYDLDSLGAGGGTTGDADPDAGADAGLDGPGADTDPPCPGKAGPAMVDLGSYCIDATEVTVADYIPFAAASLDVLSKVGKADPCYFVRSLEPDDFEAQKQKPAFPIRNVHFCHASMYCAWAGKRLCGHIGGGSVGVGDAGADPHTNEWLRACTHDGRQDYSYGATVVGDQCPGNKVQAVKSRTACGGPYPDLFDMVGNVGEWIDACELGNPLGSQHDACTVVGVEHIQGQASCHDYDEVSRYQVSPYLGFRCCGR